MDFPRASGHSRRAVLRRVLAALVLALLLPAAYSAVATDAVELGPGTVEQPAENTTYVSVQGFHFAGYGKPKKPARLVAADPDAEVEWRFDGDSVGANWFYEVDTLSNGNLFVTATNTDGTVVFEYDPATGEPVWTHELPGAMDTHNVNLLSGRRLLVANMRNFDESTGVSDDRLYIEDTESGETEWEWLFREHYPNDTDGGFSEDWTHVNDVDLIGDDERYVLASPRNFDQAIVVDRETDEIVMRLGSDDDHEILYEQHNPEYLEREDGTPVVLVADSENDRVVEYERDCGDADPRLGAGTPPEECEWERTWSVDGFNWPRDADRLPNGNTLVTDTLNHRVVEITPEGEVVWEFYAAWAPYDAERGEEGANGPTMADHGTGGNYTVTGGGDSGPASQYTVGDGISDFGSHTPWSGAFDELATRYSHVEPFFRPVGIGSWAFLSLVLGLLVALGWGVGEAVVHRRRITAGIGDRLG
ncbi:aryl-sulfate sulfotransferase [Natronomonas salina]|uniref:aryl-sulfate sulfotransferase n=1 Tax=Natronomonas salina TaxID=1710540 RepID=UPI0015B479D7|nr:aryl-sulfate sulfotransferase [Natronomonas salina]QLD88915.1 aryl-sulfate sulfotransferase [Natronomonas salina]